MRNDIDTNIFKKQLEEELILVERELQEIGSKRPLNGSVDWEPTPGDIDTDSADENEVADKMEELEENAAVLAPLEARYKDIKEALEKIEEGTYGFCEVSNEPIEEDRLLANPSARTCKAHMN